MNGTWDRRAVLSAVGAWGGLSASGLLMAGCAPGRDDGQQDDKIRFRDMAGDLIVLPRPAQRIVDLWTVGTAFAIAAHGTPARIVAVNDIAHALFRRGLIGRFYPEVHRIPFDVSIGNGVPNIERLLALDPDVVVDFRDGGRDRAAAMRNAGLRVANYTAMEGGVRRTIAALLLMYGRMIGDTSRAEHVIAVMERTSARLDALRAIPQAARPAVLLVTPLGGRFHVSGGGAGDLFSDFLYAAGGINAAAALPGLAAVSPEQIAAWDPEVILIFQSEEADPALVYDHPVIGAGRAAVSRRVYVVPIGANNWGSMGPDEFLSPIWLAELLHPRIMAAGLRDDMRQAYAAIFDRELSDKELDGILRNDLNATAADYARFAG
jgi:iron complex transport system substrate-binding protein